MPARLAAVVLLLSCLLALSACGAATPAPPATGNAAPPAQAKLPPPGRFLSVDAAAHRVTVTLIAAYDGANGGFNFDGYSRVLMWVVPRGWTVHVVYTNRGPLRYSCAVVRGADSTVLAFPGAAAPQPFVGLEAGRTVAFSFRATRSGTYRFASLVAGQEDARMWDVLKIAPGAKPAVVDLLAG